MELRHLIFFTFVAFWNVFVGGLFFGSFITNKSNMDDCRPLILIIGKAMIGPCFAFIIYHHLISTIRLYKIALVGLVALIVEALFLIFWTFSFLTSSSAGPRMESRELALVLLLVALEVVSAFRSVTILCKLHKVQCKKNVAAFFSNIEQPA